MQTLFAPFLWLFSAPKGSIGKKISGYYWRLSVMILIGIGVSYQFLADDYPTYFTSVQGGVDSGFGSEAESIIATIAATIASVVAYALLLFILSLPIQFVRLLIFVFKKPSEEERSEDRRLWRKFVKDYNAQVDAENAARAAERTARKQREKSRQIIRLNADDVYRVKRYRTFGKVGAWLSGLASALVAGLILFLLPSYLRDDPRSLLALMADIIETLPLHFVIFGGLLYLFLSSITYTIERKLTHKVARRYGWVGHTEYKFADL